MDWRIKASIQKVLSTFSLGDKLNHLGSRLMNPSYMHQKLQYHINEALIHLRRLDKCGFKLGETDTFLELGTGYAIVESLTMTLLGVSRVVTVDITKDVKFDESMAYLNMLSEDHVRLLASHSRYNEEEIWRRINDLKASASMDDFLARANITYIAPYSVADLRPYADCITVCYSQVVLEHIPEPVMWDIFGESRSWLVPGGYHSHIVNLTDHFCNPGFFRDNRITDVNFLKYSNNYWNAWCGNDIAYVNRLRFPFYVRMFNELGFTILDIDKQKDRDRMNTLLSDAEIHDDIKSKYDKAELMDTLWVQRFHMICQKDGVDVWRHAE